MNGLKKKELQNLRKGGKKFVFFPIILIYQPSNNLSIAVSTSKKLGNACFRNKIRRRIKYIFQSYKFLIVLIHSGKVYN